MSNTDTPTRDKPDFHEPWTPYEDGSIMDRLNDTVCWEGFNQDAARNRAIACVNLLAGHDLSQVVVLDKAVVEKLKDGLQYGCSTHDKFTRERCREALASLNAGGEV